MNTLFTRTLFKPRLGTLSVAGALAFLAAVVPLPHAQSSGTGSKQNQCKDLVSGMACDLGVGEKAESCRNGGSALDCNQLTKACGYFEQVTVPCGDPMVQPVAE